MPRRSKLAESLRDVSMREAARLTGHSPNYLRAHWHEIPTAFTTEGGTHYVLIAGLLEWAHERSRQVAS